MKQPELTVETKVTTVTAGTAVTLTPTNDRWDRYAGGTIGTVVINGTGLTGYTVGDRITVRISG